MRGVAALVGLMFLYPLGSCLPDDSNYVLRRHVAIKRAELEALRREVEELEARATTMTEHCDTYAAELGVGW